jgi:putative acetyltransferase
MPSRPGAAAETFAVLDAAPAQLDAVRALFREYADWLQAEICLQGFERELAELPGAYAPPPGRLLLAVASGFRRGGRLRRRAPARRRVL